MSNNGKIKDFLLKEKVKKLIEDTSNLPGTRGGDHRIVIGEYEKLVITFGRVLKSYIVNVNNEDKMLIEFAPNATDYDKKVNSQQCSVFEHVEGDRNRFIIDGKKCSIKWSMIVNRVLLNGTANDYHEALAKVILSWIIYKNNIIDDFLDVFCPEYGHQERHRIKEDLDNSKVTELISRLTSDFDSIKSGKDSASTDNIVKPAKHLLLNEGGNAKYLQRYFNNCTYDIQDILTYDDIKNGVESIDSLSSILQIMSERIIQAVNTQPLMKYLEQQASRDDNYTYEYRALANTICRYKKSEDKFYVKPVASSLLNRIKNDIADFCLTKEYSMNEMMRVISRLAEQASSNANFNFFLRNICAKRISGFRIKKCICTKNGAWKESNRKIVSSYANQIVKDLPNVKIGDKNLITYDSALYKYKFSLKQYRLVFHALYHAYDNNIKGNYESPRKTAEKIVKKLLAESNFEPIDNKDTYYPSHTILKFDSLIIYSYILLSEIDDYLFYCVIDKLFSVINDYSPMNRKKQEAAICIIAYLLSEDKWIVPKYQKRMFFFAYSQSIYENAADLWDLLPYKSLVKRAKEEALMWDTSNDYAQKPPFYIYYWNYAQPQAIDGEMKIEDSSQFLSVSCALQYHTWFGKNISGDWGTTITANIKVCLAYARNFFRRTRFWKTVGHSIQFSDELPKLNNQFYETTKTRYNLLEYIYGLNMLLASLANIERHYDGHGDYSLSRTQCFLELVILTDYLTRRVNMEYNESFNGNVTDQENNMMLLCGATRVLAVNSIREALSDQTIHLNEEMKDNYKQWLSKEKGRYKILLLRLLAFTDFTSNKPETVLKTEIENELKTEVEKKNSVFMEYDNINAPKMLELLDKGKDWKELLKTT